ncbi:MAG: serine/threonine-protein kinase, partial [Planctomycetota bacterium]
MIHRRPDDHAQAIFSRMLEEKPIDVGLFLRRECGDDRALAREVKAFLAAHDAAGSFFEELVEGEARTLFAEIQSQNDYSGRQLGSFRLDRCIGEGGFSVVYEASRTDGDFEQRVAVKVLKRGMDTASVLRSFAREKQILARFSHPNIASIIDAGTVAEGLPYFVMELCDGVPILEYCDKRRLALNDRLRLFESVCEAVQYAHQNLVIHRDLKPANIIVDESGSPKLLDFGISTLLQGDERDATDHLQRLLSLRYASPEQLRGERATTASDVFSLGIVLYELVAGVHPYEISGSELGFIDHLSARKALTLPSRSAITADSAHHRRLLESGLRSALQGDLDAIVAKSVEAAPCDRYPAVSDLVEDLRRSARLQPIRARTHSLRESVVRFAKRNRRETVVLTSVAAAVVTALVLVSVSWSGERAARHDLRKALARETKLTSDREAALALANQRFTQLHEWSKDILFDLDALLQHVPGALEARHFLLAKATPYLEQLQQARSEDPQFGLELAQAYRRVGDLLGYPAHSNLGDLPGALSHYRDGLAALREIGSPLSETPVAVLTEALLLQRICAVHVELDDLTAGERHALLALERLADLTDPSAQSAEQATYVELLTFASRGSIALTDERAELARKHYAYAAKLVRELRTNATDDLEYCLVEHTTDLQLGRAHYALGHLDESFAHVEKAISGFEDLAAKVPTDVRYSGGHVGAISQMARLCIITGRDAEAEEYLSAALAMTRTLCQQDGLDVRARKALGNRLYELGGVYRQKKDYSRALEVLVQAEGVFANLAAKRPESLHLWTRRFVCGIRTIHCQTAADQLDAASETEVALQSLLAVAERHFPDFVPHKYEAYLWLEKARLLEARDDLKGAITANMEACDRGTTLFDENPCQATASILVDAVQSLGKRYY